MKALNTECRDPVLFVSYHERVWKIPHKNEFRKRNQPISDGFPQTSKTDDSYNNENVSYIHFSSRSFGLGVGLFTKSRNNTLYQRRENSSHGEKLIACGKFFFWGKFAEGKTPIIGVTFLVKKTPVMGKGTDPCPGN